MSNILFSLTPEDGEWRVALDLASKLHVYNLYGGFCIDKDKWFRKKPSTKFVEGMREQGLSVFEVSRNHAALREYAESIGTVYIPPEQDENQFIVYFSGPPDVPIMPSGPTYHRTCL